MLLRPRKVPEKLDRALSWLPYVYLGLAVLFAGWGLHLRVGGFQIQMARRFLICEWDPFISIFRITGAFHMLAIGAVFILAGMFYRPALLPLAVSLWRSAFDSLARLVEERADHTR